MKKWNGTSILYTSSGNITSIGLDAGTYNKANQMATVTDFGSAKNSYFYDAFGQRLKVKTAGTPYQVQMYDLDGHLLTETSAAATPGRNRLRLYGRLADCGDPALGGDDFGAPHRQYRHGAAGDQRVENHRLDVQLHPLRRLHARPTTITMNLRFPGAYRRRDRPRCTSVSGILTPLSGSGWRPTPSGLRDRSPAIPTPRSTGIPTRATIRSRILIRGGLMYW